MVNGLGQQYNSIQHTGIRDYVSEDAQNNIKTVAKGAEEAATGAAQGIVEYNQSSNPILGMAVGAKNDSGKSGLYTAGTAAGFVGLNIWLNKGTLSKEWDKSLYGTLERFGDRIGKPIKEFLEKHSSGKLSGNLKGAKNWFFDKVPFLTTPTKNTWEMAKSQLTGLAGRTVNDYVPMATKVLQEGKNANEIIKGLGVANVDAALEIFKNTAGNEDKIKNLLQILSDNKSGIKPKEMLDILEGSKNNAVNFKEIMNGMSKHFGKNSADDALTVLKEITSEGGKNREALRNFAKAVDSDKIKIVGKKASLFGIPLPKPIAEFFTRTTNGNHISNKIVSSIGSDTAKTKLGKTLPRVFSNAFEGITSGHAGWTLTFIMAASFMGSVIKDTVDAPKGEKLTTFMDGLTKAVIPVGFAFLYAAPQNIVGGMKYIGMGAKGSGKAGHQAAVNLFQNGLKTLNEQVDAGSLNFSEYTIKAKELKTMLKGNAKWWQKPFKAVGNLISMGQERIKPLKLAPLNGNKLGYRVADTINTLKYQLKGKGGGLLRLAIGIAALSPLIYSVGSKIVYKIFGKPKKVQEEEAAKKTAKAEKKAQKEAKKAAKEAAKNAPPIDPQKLAERLQQHPELAATIENSPEILEQISQNPQLLIELLDEADKMKGVTTTPNRGVSPAMAEYLKNNPKAAPASAPAQTYTQQQVNQPTPQAFNPTNLNQNNMNATPKQPVPSGIGENPAQAPIAEPQRSYVPSAEPFKKLSEGQAEEIKPEVNNALLKAERAEAEAMKYLG